MIDNSYLLGLFGGTSLSSTTAGGLAPTPKKAQPTPPWSTSTKPPEPSAQLRAALAGRNFIDEGAAQLDVPGASADYRKLFALYQGLDTLNVLANRASVKGLSALELTQLQRRFSAGVGEIGDWLKAAEFDQVRLVQGTSSMTSKTSAAVPRDSARSITGPVHEGPLDSPVAAFAGDTRFGITIRKPVGISGSSTQTIQIDLAEMGAQPRTLDNVVRHINEKLEAAGVQTRFGREHIKAEPKTLQVNGRTVTLPAGPDRWALAVRGTSTETVGFTAAETSDAVYVVQAAGAGGHQLLKFRSDGGSAPAPAGGGVGETHWVEDRLSQDNLPDGVEAVRASAVGPDGSLWLVADVTAGPDTQPIKGVRDVALMKYDSAGRLVATRTLGAASTASGYAISVGSDGQVAVAGSVTGALNTSAADAGRQGDAAGVADSFVSVFDAEARELWTQRRGARAADEATAVSFGPDGIVYVGGRARSALPGAGAVGGWDGYLQAFKAGEPYPTAGIVARATATEQFGTAADDSVAAVAVDGSNLYTAGVEGGRAVVRRFTLDADGAPTLASTRDLGPISGEISGLAISDGRVVLTGASRDSGLSAGSTTTAHSGGKDVFVAALSADLAAAPTDRLNWFGGAGDDTAAGVKVHDGKVWVTGVSDRSQTAKPEDPTQGFLARLDPLTGAVEYQRTWSGEGQQARPLTLAVAAGGASVLDRLGLPQGEIDQSDSKRLIDATSLRAGDRFYVSPADGGRSVAVTIEAKDTLASLARKIEIASGSKLKVTVASEGGTVTGRDGEVTTTTGGFQRLSIMARSGKAGAVITAGEAGRDALAGLGLSPGFVGPTSGDGARKTFGLDLPADLSLGDAASTKAAGERIQAAMKAVRDAYRSLAPASATPAATGPAPAYLTAQLANYQAALSRLGG
ncbi:MAG: transcriptional regulator [Brevundimonas sp.]|uniref:transcriptional regulator n=1 Tax=Brevundimonas sp. TaxID=1871086 RepID=UPI001826316A|nr:transcriptional regulator [Brevundimonas sp.]MBA4805796.1 transcriptional regulator [Brevundimonas sp.]